jgi:hypothetical protein
MEYLFTPLSPEMHLYSFLAAVAIGVVVGVFNAWRFRRATLRAKRQI